MQVAVGFGFRLPLPFPPPFCGFFSATSTLGVHSGHMGPGGSATAFSSRASSCFRNSSPISSSGSITLPSPSHRRWHPCRQRPPSGLTASWVITSPSGVRHRPTVHRLAVVSHTSDCPQSCTRRLTTTRLPGCATSRNTAAIWTAVQGRGGSGLVGLIFGRWHCTGHTLSCASLTVTTSPS